MLVFYDTETTGINRDFDQILQFAAVLTDENLNEIERINLRCRRLPWVVPAPMALWVTGVHPNQLDDPDLPSFYEMMSELACVLKRWSPATFIGYNSIGFDEPLLQRAFWQTLHPPYVTVTNGNARMDVFPVAQATSHLYEGVLKFPESDKGRPVFKLDQLAPLNGFAHENAHDALSDVEATIHIARLIKNGAPKLWNHAVSHAAKSATANILRPGEPICVVEHFSKPAVWWGLRLDSVGAKASQAMIARLDKDWAKLLELSAEEFCKALDGSPKPVRSIALNKAPIVFDEEQAAALFNCIPPDHDYWQLDFLLGDPARISRILQAYEDAAEPWPEPEYLEQRIFENFPIRSDERLMTEFHQEDWPGKAKLIRSFEDERFQQLAQRLIYTNAPHLLDETDRARIDASIAERLNSSHEDKKLWRTLQAAKIEVSEVRNRDDIGLFANDIDAWLAAISSKPGVLGG